MLETLYPGGFRRYASLTVLGPLANDFTNWLVENRYTRSYARQRIWLLPYMEAVLIRRGIRHVAQIGESDLAACRASLLRRFPCLTGTTWTLARYLRAQGFLKSVEPKATGVAAGYLAAYAHYLRTVRGSAASTLDQNSRSAARFLTHLKVEKQPDRVKSLTIKDVEHFVKAISPRYSRTSLQHVVSRLRSFLRFLAVTGHIPQGLDRHIDGPRIYQQEQLPQTVPWETVQSLLNSIDRSSPTGHRDFTMFLLMATYGLRASDVVALTLDDICWRAAKISISQRKTGTALELPLTDTVGTALYRYLKRAPPPPPFRQIFLRVKAPIGALKASALSVAFRVWARRCGIEVPGRGSCHRIRHSYALFLLRKGTSVKTVSDLLGHRTLQSTSTYLRLAIEDLRDVALPVPQEANEKAVRA